MSTVTQFEPYSALADVYRSAGLANYVEQIAPGLFNQIFDLDWVGSVALDLGCGTGELACYLAEHGLRVIALDARREMLAHAQDSAAPKGLTIEWMQGDLRLYHPEIKVDLVTCTGGTLNYLPTLADLETAIRNAAAALDIHKPFVFDLTTIRGLAARAGDSLLTNTDQVLLISRGDFSFETLSLTLDYHILTHNGIEWRRAYERHMLRGYPVQAVTKLLAKYGLKLVRTLDDSLRPAGATETDRLIFITQKEG